LLKSYYNTSSSGDGVGVSSSSSSSSSSASRCSDYCGNSSSNSLLRILYTYILQQLC